MIRLSFTCPMSVRPMSHEIRLQVSSVAFACTLLACTPLPAFAAEDGTGAQEGVEQVDLLPVTDSLSQIDQTQIELGQSVDTLSERITSLEQYVTEEDAKDAESIEEIKEIVSSEQPYELPSEVVDSLARIDSNVELLANPPDDEVEEEEVEEETPYITLEGLSQLLMLNVAVNAVSLGVNLFSRFWNVFFGGK